MGLKERFKKERTRKRRKWPRKRFADGSLWILHPATESPVECIEDPDESKGWKENNG